MLYNPSEQEHEQQILASVHPCRSLYHWVCVQECPPCCVYFGHQYLASVHNLAHMPNSFLLLPMQNTVVGVQVSKDVDSGITHYVCIHVASEVTTKAARELDPTSPVALPKLPNGMAETPTARSAATLTHHAATLSHHAAIYTYHAATILPTGCKPGCMGCLACDHASGAGTASKRGLLGLCEYKWHSASASREYHCSCFLWSACHLLTAVT